MNFNQKNKGVSRAQLIGVFRDTMDMINSSPELMQVVDASLERTKVYGLGEDAERFDGDAVSTQVSETRAVVTVTRNRTFEAAQKLAKEYPGKRIAVLNFASATSPGGGVVDGAHAQEECLCRCSTLYPVLSSEVLWAPFYKYHRDHRSALHTDLCIYTPNVKVVKSDVEMPERLPEKDWVDVDVITCAAPNLHYDPDCVSDEELLQIHLKRGRKIFNVALDNKVDVLVLGAFGCGAFCNNPEVVAEAYRQLVEEFKSRFTAIEFAVYCNSYSIKNYDAFSKALETN